MKKKKHRMSLEEWLVQPVDANSLSHKRSLRFGKHMIIFSGLLFLYVSSVFFYHLIQFFYQTGLLSYPILLLIKALTIPKQPDSFAAIPVTILILIGYTLFLFKKHQQFYYGIGETIFAIVNCKIVTQVIERNSFGDTKPPYIVWITAITTLYLMVRGLSNINDGWNKTFYLSRIFHSLFK